MSSFDYPVVASRQAFAMSLTQDFATSLPDETLFPACRPAAWAAAVTARLEPECCRALCDDGIWI